MIKQVVRRLLRSAAGLPPYGTVEVTPADLAKVTDSLKAMDQGLHDMMLAMRAENERTLDRVRAEVDALSRDGRDGRDDRDTPGSTDR